MLNKLKLKPKTKNKTAFYASDFGKMELDIHYSLQNIEYTNPMAWNVMARLGAGKGAEEAMLTVLKDSGIVAEDYIQEEHGRVDFTREGVEIHGYVDAITKSGEPIEIKTINNKNSFDINRYNSGYPRENYVGQLAVYMDSLGIDTGYLFVISLDGLNYYIIECRKRSDNKYQCGKTVIDLQAEYQRWAKIKKNVDEKKEPNLWSKVYKIPVKEIPWSDLSASKISKARTNKAVVGDWEVLYSPYKDLIVKKQGAILGYTDDEIDFIKEETKGYSVKYAK